MSNLNEQQMEAVDYVAVHGTLAAGLRIAKLQATITELRDESIRLTTDQANDPAYASLRATITDLTAALIYYADDPESYGDVAREALTENPE